MVRHLISASAITRRWPPRLVHVALALVLLGGCNRETQVRTRDEIAADSALAADLALANRDTLLIDSIGQPRPPGIVPADTDLAGSFEGKARTAAPSPPSVPVQPSPPRVTPTAGSSTKPSAPRAAPRRSTGDPCNSPAKANQEACVRRGLAATDMRLNRIYRALLTEMRRQEGVRPGQKDPPSVERLRVAQRAWLVNRDTECRRRGRGTEGTLWARPRVQCLGEFAGRRANELADSFSRLTAR